jgi:spore maturation protein CgeB
LRIVMFYHSLVSDWNHGNAHFLRGVTSELIGRGHDVRVYEPADAWSVQGLVADAGEDAVRELERRCPELRSDLYHPLSLDLDAALDGADLVIVHEWNEPALVARIGAHRRTAGYTLLFHDTHHRAVTDPEAMARFDLRDYDGVLAFGAVLRDEYLERGWAAQAWAWHEAADARRFHPLPRDERAGDLVWIGNWGDEERTIELMRFLLMPVMRLGLDAKVHGVRYPAPAQALLAEAGVAFGGWLPNLDAPRVFSRYDVTVHVPRRVYAERLPGIPTIRVFEALACGIPLVCAPWEDSEGLFTPGQDYLTAADGPSMDRALREILHDPELARSLAEHGQRTIAARHTCAHRVDELFMILAAIAPAAQIGGDGIPAATEEVSA